MKNEGQNEKYEKATHPHPHPHVSPAIPAAPTP